MRSYQVLEKSDAMTVSVSVSSKTGHISPTEMMRDERSRERIKIILTSDMLIFTTPFLVESFLSNKAETEH